MSRKVEVEWPDFGVTVTVDLLEDENPKLCEEFWQGLPFETVFAASMSAGEMFKVPIPFMMSSVAAEKLVLFPEQPPGIVVGSGTSLFVKYGTVVEPFMVPRVGQIPEEELEKFRLVAIKLRDAYFFTKEVNKAVFRKRE